MGKIFLCLAGGSAVHGQFIFMVSAEFPGGDAGLFIERPVEGTQAFKTAVGRNVADAVVGVGQPALGRGDPYGF